MPSFAVNFINKNEHKNKLVLIAVIGALTFFVPCGFTLIAQTTAFASGNATQSAISLFAFALGTLPALLLIAFASTALYSKKTLASLFTAFSGFLIIFMGIYSIYGQLKVFGLFTPAQIEKTSSGVEVVQPQNNQVPDIQYATITAKGFEYLPKTLTLKSDISTVLTIDNEGAYGCAQALYAKGLYPEIVYLKSGENQISFTPKKGTYQISCSMGMVPPVTVYVE